MLLKDFGEHVTLLIFFKHLVINSFNEVFPQLPVIAIILPKLFSLKIEDDFVKNFKVSSTLNCLEILFNLFILLTIASDAPFLKASLTKRFPFLFLPLIAKKYHFFLFL